MEVQKNLSNSRRFKTKILRQLLLTLHKTVTCTYGVDEISKLPLWVNKKKVGVSFPPVMALLVFFIRGVFFFFFLLIFHS